MRQSESMKTPGAAYLALLTLVSAASCSREATEPDVIDWTEDIYFRTSLPDISASRAADMTLDRLESFQVTCFNTGDLNKDAAGIFHPYFEEATFIRQNNPHGTYISAPEEGPRYWPEKDGVLRFFAFSPSRAVMADGNLAINGANNKDYFNLVNTSTEADSTVAVGYRLGTVRVNPDIAGQFDFVTAEASGERWKDFTGGVELAFRHQMSQVELKAWGASPEYDFEIAGVRLGNPVVEGTFIFSDPAYSAGWTGGGDAVKDNVEYLYRGADASPDIPGRGDKVFRICRGKHDTPESAAPIMGRGGCAMVIPTVNHRWEGLADPDIANMPYTTGKMYFSILLRVTDPADGKPLYPYPGNPYGMTVIYYAVDQTDAIVKRLYPGQEEGIYFTDSALQHPYVAADGETVKDFGWAAVPVDADWGAGKRYVYTLDYSEGIGLHDPQDPEPGKPIAMVTEPVSWGVTVDEWEDAPKSDDYDPDVNVP